MNTSDMLASLTVRPSLQAVLRDFIAAIASTDLKDNIVLKGGMNLEVAIHKYNKSLLVRPTIDIDLHLMSVQVWTDFLKKVSKDISNNSALSIKYTVMSTREDPVTRNDTAKISTSVGHVFSVDMNISSYKSKMEFYVAGYLNGYSVVEMLADKCKVFVSKRIYSRSKDLYDLFILSKLMDYSYDLINAEFSAKIQGSGGIEFPLHFHDIEKLEHAYERLKGIPNKPLFPEVYDRVLKFVPPLVTSIMELKETNGYTWDCANGVWRYSWT